VDGFVFVSNSCDSKRQVVVRAVRIVKRKLQNQSKFFIGIHDIYRGLAQSRK
jgi:hypothetical protein